MRVSECSIIYENPLPQLKARKAYFPNLCLLDGGELAAAFAIGQAMESVDQTSYLARSNDGGRTWSEPIRMFSGQVSAERERVPVSDVAKITRVGDGRLIDLGYRFRREDPDCPLGNPETGGLLEDEVFWAESRDSGVSWSEPSVIPTAWNGHTEASAPVTVLKDGDWVTPITGFPGWDGRLAGVNCGRLLRSSDQGKSWQDETVCMDFPGHTVLCYEQRLCQLEASGDLVVIAWNEDTAVGRRMTNHYTVSHDNGKTFSEPRDTGIMGQASSVCALGGNELLSLHACRRDTERPGIYGCRVLLEHGEWKTEEKKLLWEPGVPVVKNDKFADVFAYLKFGQPSAVRLSEKELLMTHWFEENGEAKIAATRIEL